MGAYFTQQVFKQNGDLFFNLNAKNLTYGVKKVRKDRKDDWIYVGGYKFLESHYFLNLAQQSLLKLLKEKSSKENPLILNTVCDYDDYPKYDENDSEVKSGAFEYMKKFDEGLIFFVDYNKNKAFLDVTDSGLEIKDVKKIGDFLEENYQYEDGSTLKEKDPKKANEKINANCVFSGYIVCEEKEQYIDLSKFAKRNLEINDLIVSPLSLLTRSSTEDQGGGDISFDRVLENQDNLSREDLLVKLKQENEIRGGEYIYHSGHFDIDLIGSWKDLPIYFTESLNDEKNIKLKQFKDISEKICLEPIWI